MGESSGVRLPETSLDFVAQITAFCGGLPAAATEARGITHSPPPSPKTERP